MYNYLDELNEVQGKAVQCTEGPLMIIAGAGSGKTRVITYRIAHLLNNGVDPFHILVLTFTNKAAREMRERITKLAGAEARNLWMGTFHSVFARILRQEAEHIGYPKSFTIYDTEDSKALLKTIIKELHLDDKMYNANYVLSRISAAKNNLISAKEYKANAKIQSEDQAMNRDRLSDIYAMYEQRCYKAGAMDFDDLLFKTNILLRNFPEICQKYQNLFRYVMVDEYQDTNYSQYIIVKRLAALHKNVCVVGDDAQSIYSFRGADISNILNFQKDYPDAQIFKLEQNYRSTRHIVEAANSIIKKNKNQLEKSVFSENEQGDKIRIVRAVSDNEEGYKVVQDIRQNMAENGILPGEFAVLYRTNAQTRALEEAFRRGSVPYKIFGGMSFYQRKEIKDLIAYFRLTINPNDEEALKRVINYPVRGIGKTSLDSIILMANEQNVSLWEIVSNFENIAKGRGVSNVANFAVMIRSFQALATGKTAFETAEHIAGQSGILKELYADKTVEGLAKYEHVQELLNGIKEFSEREDIEDRSLNQFLIDVALLTGDESEDKEDKNVVSLMTIHASKGLEFKNVYIVGIEENLFPSQRSLNSRTELEEERRLFYVATTRAEKRLTLSYATSRYKFGTLQNGEPSRFLDEINPDCLDINGVPSMRFRPTEETATSSLKASVTPFRTTQILPKAHTPSGNFIASDSGKIQVGMQVEHERFGFGKVIAMEGTKPDIKATVFFKNAGQKQLLLKFAKLKIIE